MANAPMQDITRTCSVVTVAAIAAALALIPDASIDSGGKLPVTGVSVTQFAGILPRASVAGQKSDVVRINGDTGVLTASGTVTAGDPIYIDATSGKEGRGKTFAGEPTNGRQLVIGFAATSAVDGNLFEIVLQIGSGPVSNQQVLSATLVGGTVTVNAGVTFTATSKIFLSRSTLGGTAGNLSHGAITPGAPGTGSVVITSSSGTDTSVINLLVIG